MQRVGMDGFQHLGSHFWIGGLVIAVEIALGVIGNVKLNREGQRDARRFLSRITLFAFGLTFVVIQAGGFSDMWLCAAFAFIAIPFPVAFYLNRNRNKPTAQPTDANAR